MAETDETDQQIIALLRENARRSFQDIGEQVSLSAPAVKRRVDRLEADGVIRGYTATVEPSAFGWHSHAFVELFCEGRMSGAEVSAAVSKHPEVEGAYTIAGDAERDPARAGPRHPAPGAGAGADPRDRGREPHPDPGRALHPVRAPGHQRPGHATEAAQALRRRATEMADQVSDLKLQHLVELSKLGDGCAELESRIEAWLRATTSSSTATRSPSC